MATPVVLHGDFFQCTGMKKTRIICNVKPGVQVVEAVSMNNRQVRKAVKMTTLLDSTGKPKDLRVITKETTVMNLAQHPNIMKMDLFAICDGFSIICMPLCSKGALDTLRLRLEPVQMERYFIQTACALRYLHRKNIIHGDVKAANILIDASDNAILSDFDQSRVLAEGQTTVSTWGGTPGYVGPEYYTHTQVNPFLVSLILFYSFLNKYVLSF